jgi:cytochrome b6-f complex iron-sulfur subunit
VSDLERTLPCRLTRRTFCVQAGETAALAALAAALHGCGSPTSPSTSAPALPTMSGSLANGQVSVTVDPSSPLGSVGGAALVQASNQFFLVARTSANGFTALTAICTHEGCTITGFQSPMYVCPCHGSQYSASGAVLSGPANQSLRQFTTQFSNNVLSITL